MIAIKHTIERFLLVWLVLLSGLAYFWDRVGIVDIFEASRSYLSMIIAVTMFAIGCMLPRDEVRLVMQRWPTVLGGTVVQYVAMPSLAYLLATQFQLSREYFIGVMMVGCVPGAMASNVLTLVAKGNTSYSVSLTTLATMLSPVMVPFALQLTLGDTVSSTVFIAAAVKLSWMVVLPVALGHFVACNVENRAPEFKVSAQIVGSIVANLTILWIVAFVVATNRQSIGRVDRVLLIVLLLLNLLGYFAGFVGGKILRLPDSMRRALTLEVGMQNAGLGTALVVSLFPDQPQVTIPPAIYTFGCMLTGTILARLWGNSDASH